MRLGRVAHIGFGFLFFFMLLLILSGCKDGKKAPLQIGDPAPDFIINDMNGKTLHLASWKGKPVVLRFWDTECKHCLADTPVFNQYFKKYKEKGLKVVYINTGKESVDVVTDFVKNLKIPFPVVREGGAEVAALFNVRIVPQTVIIDPEQTIIAAIPGGVRVARFKELVGKFLN